MNGDTPISQERSGGVRELARILYEEMERLDPGPNAAVAWDALTRHERELYYLCIESVFEHTDLVLQLLAHNDVVLRHSHTSE